MSPPKSPEAVPLGSIHQPSEILGKKQRDGDTFRSCVKMHDPMYIYTLYTYTYKYMPFPLKMSKNIKSLMRHLKFSYISIFTNLLRTQFKSP